MRNGDFDFAAAERNASTIREAIRDLKNCQPNEFWGKVKDINNLFKELKPLKREDRERLWAEFQSLIGLRKTEQEKMANKSRVLKDHILSLISSADARARAAENAGQFADANDKLREAMSFMKDGWEAAPFNPLWPFVPEARLLKSDREECSEKWRQANEALKYRREDIYKRNYDSVRGTAGNALNAAYYADPYEALNVIKSVNAELKNTEMSKPQREVVRGDLQDAWKKAISRIEEMREAKKKKQEEWERKNAEWRRRQEGLIEQWSEIIERKQDQISRAADNIRRNEDRDAKGDFANVVEGWIRDDEQKIQELTADIRDLERKTSDVQSKLRQ